MQTIRLIQKDITQLAVDAIVNAANASLLGGGGVDGAIHRAAGPELLAECRKLGGCLPGQAKITFGYQLPAKHVIHTVGPVWGGGTAGEAGVLDQCYRSCLLLAVQNNLRSIAFPSISTGAFGYPLAQAAVVAMGTVTEFLSESPLHQSLEVTFALFSSTDLAAYKAALNSQYEDRETK